MSFIKKIKLLVVILAVSFLAGCSQQINTSNQNFGNISFINSGSPEAQLAFLEGVKALHSFQFDGARIGIRRSTNHRPIFRNGLLGPGDE